MNNLLVLVGISALGAAVSASEPQTFRFDFRVQIDARSPTMVRSIMAPGEVRTISVNDALRFEIAAPARVDIEAVTTTKLIRSTATGDVVLHSAMTGGPATFHRTATYGICSGRENITYIAPEPTEPFFCK